MSPDLGRAGFVVAIVAVVLVVIQQLASVFVPLVSAQTALSYSLFYGVFGVVHAVVSAVALVLGILGAQRRRSPVLSGIAIGVGGAGVISAVIGLVVIPMAGFLA